MTELNPEHLDTSTPKASSTDPQLDALLDDALMADDLPAGLNDRIVAATAGRLPGGADDAPAVIGRIGGGFAWRSIAAVLLFALVLGGVWVVNQDSGITPTPSGGSGTEVLVNADPAKIETALEQLAESELDAEWIDDRIDILSMQVTWAQDAGDSGVWGDGAFESLDTAIARETFDDVADEMEWYF